MHIKKGTKVTISYTLTDDEGNEMQGPEEQPVTFIQGEGTLMPGLEEALEGKTAGSKVKITVTPEDGYGHYDEERILRVPKDSFEGIDLEVGKIFASEEEEGKTVIITILEIDGDEVVIDTNHPLAGTTLIFDVLVESIED